MIKAHNGHIEIEGTGNILFADYACISNVLVDELGVDALFHGFALGVEDKTNGNVLGCVAGAVEKPKDAKTCTLNLAMILNAIVNKHGDNAEKIIKTAADIATTIKKDSEVENIDQMGAEVIELLKGVDQ